MKVALVYDRVNKWGGAERVLLALHKLFPKAPLYTSVYNRKTTPWAKVFDVKYSFLQYFPNAISSHESYALLMPQAFESFSFDQYDLVISVTSEAAKGIITSSKTLHVCYLLTPTRYLWSGYTDYFQNPLLRTLAIPAVSYLRRWDLIAARRPDAYIAISKEVKKRIKKYYHRDAQVIYPPMSFQKVHTKMQRQKKIENNYFLIVSRLVPYKRIDIAIEACNVLGISLKIVGTGSEEQYLRSLAGPTIEFVGSLTEENLLRYYRGSSALLFPGIEDFGLTAIEAQSFGKPVIAYKGGGLLETVVDGKTGRFFYPQTADALQKALQAISKQKFNKIAFEKNVARFQMKTFEKEFTKEINYLLRARKHL